MEGLGQLAYRKGGNALAYRKGGNTLVYKGSERLINLIANWSPNSFICKTYNETHYVNGSYTWHYKGGLVYMEISKIGDGVMAFQFRVAECPTSIVLTLTGSMYCAADEYVDIIFRLMASQRGVSPIMKKVQPPGAAVTSSTITVDVDENGNVTGIS